MKPHKRKARLQARQKDFLSGTQSKESKVQQRWESRGYHKPGSNNK